jgi:hypothetical protein
MRLFIIALSLLAASCGAMKHHGDESTQQPFDAIKTERDARVQRFDVNTIERCDRITFLALFDAYGKQQDTLFWYETKPGHWERHFEACYPKDSQSTISRDGLISVLHALKTRGDDAAIKRMYDYGKEHGWDMGEGPWDLVNATPIVPVIAKLAGKPILRDRTEADPFTSFRGHVLGCYIWLSAKAYGAIGDVELEVLRTLRDKNPDSPFFHALYHRFTDGDQTAALERMKNIGTSDAPFGWGSAPADVYYAITVAVLEGK